MSVLFTDSNCELHYTTIDKLGIKLIEMPYTLDGEERFYDDGKDPSFIEIYKRMKEGAKPITSALSPQNYIDYFEPVLAAGEDVFYVSFSHELSGTFNYMNMAIAELKEKYPDRKITVFDTKNISFGGGIQVLEAVKLRGQGLSDEEVLLKLEEFRSKIRVYFYVSSLTYLKRGGRVSSTSAVFGNMLDIKPILRVDESGKIVKYQTVHGIKKALSTISDIFMREAELSNERAYYILDADAKKDADELKEIILTKSGGKVNIERYNVGPVITSHCGPGTSGIIYVAK